MSPSLGRLGRLSISLLLVCAAGALPPAPVRAAETILFTNTNDSDEGSLRWAIGQADDGDTIQVGPSILGSTITLDSPLVVDKDLTILGPFTLHAWAYTGTPRRALEIAEDATVTISNVTVSSSGGIIEEGGGILNRGTLTFGGGLLYLNRAATRGGALANYGVATLGGLDVQSNGAVNGAAFYNAPGATLRYTGGTFTTNNGDGSGGAIYNEGAMELTYVTFDRGSGKGDGGAIYNTGTMTITNAIFTMVTTTGKGGAIANAGTLTVNDAEFTYTQDNAGSDLGGAIWNAASGTLAMTDSSWLNSNAGVKGGALYTEGAATIVGASMRHCDADRGGAIYVGATGALTVTASWMQDNTARTNAGGAICSEGSLTVRDSTFMNNASSMDGGAILVEYGSVADIRRSTVAYNSTSGCGGGIAVAGTLVLENSTLHANNAGFCGAGLSVSGAAHSAAVIHTTISSSGGGATDGKGLCSYAPTYLANSIVAHSIGGTDCVAPPEWGNTTNGHNLVADGSCWGTSGNPLLLDLREYYGGDIHTQALTEGSPAVDAGDPDDCPATDQRGVARPQGAGCDLGAYEATAPTATTDPASNVAATGAMLRGTVRSPGWPTDVTFEYGLTTDYGATAASPQNPVNALLNTAVSAAVADLEPNRTYHYRIVAENGVGTTIGEDRTFTTLAVAPTVATGAADGLSAEGATIHGTVNAHNSDAAVFFDYGATDQYGESLAGTPDLATGNANTLVHAVLAGLDPNTAYHYRVRATNAVSTTYGDDATFTTAVVPPIVTTLPASGVTSSGATLRATVNARNADTSVTFEYGTTAGYGTTATGTPGVATGLGDTAVSVTLEGLLPNTTYHYRVVGASDGGTVYGADEAFTTDPVPPTAVTEAGATFTGPTSAIVYGTVTAHYADTAVAFHYGPDTGYGEVAAADPGTVTGDGATGVSALLTGLVPGETTHYRVVAESIGGRVEGVDRILVVPPAPPLAVTEAAGDVTLEGATLRGTVNARNEATTVWFEYGPTSSYGGEATADPATVSGVADRAVQALLVGLAPNTTYHYRVVAENATGRTYGQDRPFATGAPEPMAETGAATGVGTTSATLLATVNGYGLETAVTFEYGETTSYEQSIAGVPEMLTIAANTAVTATVTGLTPGTTYHYRVVAESAGGRVEGADRTLNTADAPSVTTLPPSQVSPLGAEIHATVNARGLEATVTFEYGETSAYGMVAAGAPSPVTGESDVRVTAVLWDLVPGSTYHYRAVATYAGGSIYGEDLTFSTPAVPPHPDYTLLLPLVQR